MKTFPLYLFVDIDISDIVLEFQTVDFDICDIGDYKKIALATGADNFGDINRIKEILNKRAGEDVCFVDPFYLVSELLLKNNLKLSTIESCTGGLIGKRLTDIPGSSRYYERGFITYSNSAKISLGVEESVIEKYGAVSRQTASEMARACLKNSSSDIAVSVTGIAGPEGATEDKRKGLVWFAIADKREVKAHRGNFSGSRGKVREAAANFAINLVRKLLS